jgi:hypothetical protein
VPYKCWDIYKFKDTSIRVFENGVYVGHGNNRRILTKIAKLIGIDGAELWGTNTVPTTRMRGSKVIKKLQSL